MTTREQKIKAIYEKIANKELSFGCKCLFKNSPDEGWSEGIYLGTNKRISTEPNLFRYNSNGNVIGFDINNLKWGQGFEKEGHPVMIGDILKYIANKFGEYSFTIWGDGVISFGDWKGKYDLSKPIEEQSDECIDYIYNLLCDE